ncbi:hypothetical protein ABWK50_28265 [Priestia megaterium]|jgi:membrane protein DedA with SNARE-associated domain|uniref:hypothetical protein n=1 Tax=Priestia megaterium TaxID=1404 RepID=UPI0033922793
MNLRLYALLTIIGIAPTTFLFLSIGHFYDGDTETIIETIADYQSLLLIGFVMITVGYVAGKCVVAVKKKKDAKSKMIG